MIAELINIWDITYNFIHGILLVLVPCAKLFFTMPWLPFTILSIIGYFVKARAHR